jgi:organic radical activating enzyme
MPKTPVDSASHIGAISLPIRRLHVELTNRCNFACEFCPDGRMRRPRGTMSLSTVERILSEAGGAALAREAHFHVMGDPLLYPDLPHAIHIGRRSGLDTWVTTNGSLLTPALVREFRHAGLSHLVVSLQTPDAETFALRGARQFTFEEYQERIVTTVRSALNDPNPIQISVCFLVNPLRRFRAPNPPNMRVGESGTDLRAHMERWSEWLLEGTSHGQALRDVQRRIQRAGILKENRVQLTPHLHFQVRALGNWAEHFSGPISPAHFGYCQGVTENLGILWSGDYVICCTDFDGCTAMANASEVSLLAYLGLPAVQDIVRGFKKFRVVHPHCRQCLGDRNPVSAFCRQIGSILYFKVYRPYMQAQSASQS